MMGDVGILRAELEYELQNRDDREIDAQLSLFIVAANSLRHYSSLRPFPHRILSSSNLTDENDIQVIRQLIKKIPSVKALRNYLHNSELLCEDTVRLLHWILLNHPTGLRLTIVKSDNEVNNILRLTGSETRDSLRPNYVFKIFTNKSSRLESQYRGELKGGIYGYHGSKLHNIYSILSNGLHQHKNEVSLFGQGIYLSTDLQVVQYFSGSSTNWSESNLGKQANCVLLCECYDHPDVKMSSRDPSRSYIAGSEGGRVPDKYIVVQSNDLLINKYLFFYSRGNSEAKNSNIGRGFQRLRRWIWKHFLLLFFLSYVLILFVIGLSKSSALYRTLREWGILY